MNTSEPRYTLVESGSSVQLFAARRKGLKADLGRGVMSWRKGKGVAGVRTPHDVHSRPSGMVVARKASHQGRARKKADGRVGRWAARKERLGERVGLGGGEGRVEREGCVRQRLAAGGHCAFP